MMLQHIFQINLGRVVILLTMLFLRSFRGVAIVIAKNVHRNSTHHFMLIIGLIISDMKDNNIVKANIMVQIAINKARTIEAPKFNKGKFEKAAEYALSLTRNHTDFYPILRERFKEAGVIFVVLPNLPGSKTNGATKKIGDNILLMVNNRRLFSDTFWFTLFHEIGHIMNGDYGITFEGEDCEDAADKYAEDKLIPSDAYQSFIQAGRFDVNSIRRFANLIDRDPGIILGRLKNDKKVSYDNWQLSKAFSHQYNVKCS